MADYAEGTAIISFSRGKDSIAAWLQMRKFFKRIIPVYLYGIPGLSFVEDSLKYYEDFFGTRIYRFCHRSTWRMLDELLFQPPQNVRVIWDVGTQDYDFFDIFEAVKDGARIVTDTYTGVGVRSADSPQRRMSIVTHGPINTTKLTFYPIYDWNKKRIVEEMLEAKVKLPIDYKLFGRTRDGFDYRFMEPLRRYFPEDFQKCLDYFPLADLEIFRQRCRERYYLEQSCAA